MKDKEYFKKLLLELKEQINEQIEGNKELIGSNIKDSSGEHSSYSFHLADMGSDTMDRENAFWRASLDKSLYNEVLHALGKIETGEYGICEECGEGINENRLEALPHARLCLNCKLNQEMR